MSRHRQPTFAEVEMLLLNWLLRSRIKTAASFLAAGYDAGRS